MVSIKDIFSKAISPSLLHISSPISKEFGRLLRDRNLSPIDIYSFAPLSYFRDRLKYIYVVSKFRVYTYPSFLTEFVSLSIDDMCHFYHEQSLYKFYNEFDEFVLNFGDAQFRDFLARLFTGLYFFIVGLDIDSFLDPIERSNLLIYRQFLDIDIQHYLCPAVDGQYSSLSEDILYFYKVSELDYPPDYSQVIDELFHCKNELPDKLNYLNDSVAHLTDDLLSDLLTFLSINFDLPFSSLALTSSHSLFNLNNSQIYEYSNCRSIILFHPDSMRTNLRILRLTGQENNLDISELRHISLRLGLPFNLNDKSSYLVSSIYSRLESESNYF